jgi:hypothetical protein
MRLRWAHDFAQIATALAWEANVLPAQIITACAELPTELGLPAVPSAARADPLTDRPQQACDARWKNAATRTPRTLSLRAGGEARTGPSPGLLQVAASMNGRQRGGHFDRRRRG